MRTLTMLIAALFLAACEKSQPPDAPEIVAAKTLLPYLRDPDGVVFRLPPVQKPITERREFYCGLVNAKNGYGGMTGMLTFAVLLGKAEDGFSVTFYDIDGPDRAAKTKLTLTDYCGEVGYPPRLLFEAPEWRPPVPSRG